MIKSTKLTAIALFAVASIFTTNVNAQLKTPAPSPAQTVKQAFALSEITIDYSRPGVKNRTIFGDVVPFGKVWRTGANGSTKITFGEDVKVEGNDVKAGTYAIYSVPDKDMWEIMLYKDLTMGGDVGSYKKEDEVLRFKVKSSALSSNVETFTINVADVTPSKANIELQWEKTRVAFSVVADIDTKIMKNIENTVIKDTKPYFSAASYYYENDKDMKQALEWVEKAITANPKAYWVVLLKAKIQVKLKDNKGASATAAQVVTLAKEDQNDDYVKMAEKIIADAKGK